jgi:hypothetical protein
MGYHENDVGGMLTSPATKNHLDCQFPPTTYASRRDHLSRCGSSTGVVARAPPSIGKYLRTIVRNCSSCPAGTPQATRFFGCLPQK